MIRLSNACRADIDWWREFVESWNGVSFLQQPQSLTTVEVTTDASGGHPHVLQVGCTLPSPKSLDGGVLHTGHHCCCSRLNAETVTCIDAGAALLLTVWSIGGR